MTDRGQRAKTVRKLRELLKGEVLSEARARRKFSRDQSIFRIDPLAVARPADHEDIVKLLGFAAATGLAVTPRGGGSGTAGGALGQGVVIALPRTPYWQEINEFSVRAGRPLISMGAGIYHNDLQRYLRQEGYQLPVDVTSAAISRIGGNVATKASGPHALRYGAIDRFVEHLVFVTARGEVVNTADPRTIPADIGQGLADLGQRLLADRRAVRILNDRREMKTSSGYNMFAFLKGLDTGNLLAQLLVGSNGTLGLITNVTLRGERYVAERAMLLLAFTELAEAVRAVPAIRELGVEAIEIMDQGTVDLIVRKTGKLRNTPSGCHLLLVECAGAESRERIARINTTLSKRSVRLAAEPIIAVEEKEIEALWEVRRRILPLLTRPGPHLTAPAIVNDIGVDPSRLAECIVALQKIFRRHDIEVLIYGHAGSGNLHLRPLFDMNRPDPARRLQRLADEVYSLVLSFNGTVAAEHGTGRLKAPYLAREWGEALYGYMREVKEIMDPQGILNPGVMFNEAKILENLGPEWTKRNF